MSRLNRSGYTNALYFKNTGELNAGITLNDDAALRTLHQECTGHKGKYYFDVCVFHAEDNDLFKKIYADEAQG